MAKNFAFIGAAAAVAARHLQAIADVGGRIVAAMDPSDSVAALDAFGDLEVPFFTDAQSFDRHLELLQRGPADARAHYVTVCSPNYLHDAHCRLGLRLNADVICEKPVVIDPRQLDPLRQLEERSGRRVWTILQLRADERLIALRDGLRGARHDVVLTYVAARGRWYDASWKGDADRSGGVATNIGVHMFDLLVWLFGAALQSSVHLHEPRRMAGALELERARVVWFLSVDERDLPPRARASKQRSFRAITVDGRAVEFSSGSSQLHTRVYERTLAGEGFGLDDARPSIELAHDVRRAPVVAPLDALHPFLRR